MTRLVYLKIDPFNSDIGSYARYSYFYLESLNMERDVYEIYSMYIEEKAKGEAIDSNRKSIISRKNIEYPPFTILWLSIPGFFIKFFSPPMGMSEFNNSYLLAYRIFMLVIDSLFFLLFLYVLLGITPHNKKSYIKYKALYFIICGLCLFIYSYYRLDLTLGFFTLLSACFLFIWGRPIISFFVLALAINYKISPIFLIPIWAVGALPIKHTIFSLKQGEYLSIFKNYSKNIFSIVGMTFVVFLPFLLAYGMKSTNFIRYHSSRPIQIESYYSILENILAFFGHKIRIVYSFGSINVISSLTPFLQKISIYVMLLFFAVLFFYIYKAFLIKLKFLSMRDNIENEQSIAQTFPRIFVSSIILIFIGEILTFKVFSPQFILWFAFLIPLASFKNSKTTVFVSFSILSCCLLSSYIYPYVYREHIVNYGHGPTTWGGALLILRNSLLLISFIVIASNLIPIKMNQSKKTL